MFARLTVGEGLAGPECLPRRLPAWRRSTVLYMLFPVLAAVALIATLAIGLARTSLSACGTAASSLAPRPAAACGAHALRPTAGTGSPEPGRRRSPLRSPPARRVRMARSYGQTSQARARPAADSPLSRRGSQPCSRTPRRGYPAKRASLSAAGSGTHSMPGVPAAGKAYHRPAGPAVHGLAGPARDPGRQQDAHRRQGTVDLAAVPGSRRAPWFA